MTFINKKIRIALTGGGTVGHIAPLVAVVRSLVRLSPENTQFRYIGGNGFSKELMTQEEVRVDIIKSGKFRRYFSLANITDMFKLAIGILQALWKLYWYMPDIVFAKGGHGSLPVIVAAVFYRIPIVIHESDSVPGIVSKFAGMFAKKIGISFPNSSKYFKQEKTVLVGNPIRKGLLENLEDEKEARQKLGLYGEKPVVLVLGGSQGSQRINDFMLEVLPSMLNDFQVIHQTGKNNIDNVQSEANIILENAESNAKARYHAHGFLSEDNYKRALQVADIVVSRAGSGAIFEIAAFGKPSVLLPLKEAAGDHQRINAVSYFQAGCCIYFEENNLLPNLFLEQLRQLWENEDQRNAMSEACKNFARVDAAKDMAKEILDVVGVQV